MKCLVCEKTLRYISPSHLKNHSLTPTTYREVFGLNRNTSLSDYDVTKKLSIAMKRDKRYEKSPCYKDKTFIGKQRRINIIFFLSKEWKKEWNGANELWNKDITKCIVKTEVKFNRAIIFKTNDISWHGVPDKIICPNNMNRKSLAYYYVSPLNTIKPHSKYRQKANYSKRPNDKYDENMEKLYKIRETRRITKEDMDTYLPGWTLDK